MLGGHISHHNSHYISHLLSSVLLAFSLLSGWLSVYKSPIVFAADASPIVADPAHTQDFFSAFGDASVQRAADGSWSQVVLTPAQVNQAGAVTLNNRLDFSKSFNLKYSMLLGNNAGQGDGISFALYPGQLGAVGMFGGNMGVAGLPNALGFKFDNYTNQADNMVTNGTNVDTEFGFGKWATQVSKPGTPSYVAGQINPYTDTVKYAEHLRQNNSSGAVWGTVDQNLNIFAPYGSFIETNEAGYLKIMDHDSNHLFLRNNVKDTLPSVPINTLGIPGKVIDGPARLTTDLADGKWHNVQIDYQVANGIGTFTVSLYRDTTYTNLNKSWTAWIDIAEMKKKTNNKPYFALNIAGSNGSSTANQAIRNLYAEYTPEPGAFTTRFVDENGTTIKDAINQGGSDDLVTSGTQFTVDIPGKYTRTKDALKGNYKFDYATLETYDGSPTIQKVKVDPTIKGDNYTFTDTYKAPYRRLNVYYKKIDSYPTVAASIAAGQKSIANDTDTLVVDQPNTPITYEYTLALPKSAPDSWNKVTVQTMLPAGLLPTTTTAIDQNGSVIPITTSQENDGHTKVTLGPIDLFGTAAFSQPNTVKIKLTLNPIIPLTGAIETTAQDTYKQDISTTPQPPTSYWENQPPKTIRHIEVSGTQTIAQEPIEMNGRKENRVVFKNSQLHLPAGVTQVDTAERIQLPDGLLSNDITITRTTVANMLPTVAAELTASGQKKLTGSDSVHVGVLYSGKDAKGITYWWVVDYVLYEPLNVWMPSQELAQSVAKQLKITSDTVLQKSMMKNLQSFTDTASKWTIAQDPTGLEYATSLQTFDAPGTNAAAEQVKDSFRRLLTTFATDRGQAGTPAATLTTLTLSNYPKEVFMPTAPATNQLPELPALTTFTATQDGLESAQLTSLNSKDSDLAAFLSQPAAPKLQKFDISNNEPAVGNANPTRIPTRIIGPAAIAKIDQTNMIVPGIALSVAVDKDDPNKITITSPKDGNGNAIDLRTKLSTLALDSGATVPFTAADAAKTTVEFFDQGTSKPSDTNADLTKFIDKQHPGQLNIRYQDYAANTKSTTGTGYLRFSYPKDNATYSLWMPTTITGQTAIAVSGSLDFGTRRLAAGDYPNDGHDDIAGTKPAEPAVPIKITTVYNPKSQVTVQVTPFAAGSSTVNTFILRLGSHDIPAIGEGGSTVLPELTNDTGLADTQNYTAVLHVPNTAGILTGQKYSADVTYTLTDGL
ncbi:hypothetical protein LH991_01430 [Schleiferilactobacillus harbinensis]|uniref:lectin-like domain-containing protein n=1 Tax=Schleiferilactobacillus harbinensis TaxID=304207 RepID=UPI00040CD69D|nr:hypothetical protein [Schleiferilactobacillus harbinensis]QFR62743.1 hypothetical protein LH991_01430 [Schleiferilactobacillus harbinensis]